MKLLRAIFRRFGYAIIPLDAASRPDVRMAVWRAQYAHNAKTKGLNHDEWDINQLAMERVNDPAQAENDQRAFAAMVDAVEKDREP